MAALRDLRNRVLGTPEDVRASRAADRRLHTEAAHITDENDPTYLRLNGAANEAARKLPRWRRGPVG